MLPNPGLGSTHRLSLDLSHSRVFGKMAQVAAMQQMYQCLGFTLEAASNSILNLQGLRTLEDLCNLDEMSCSSLCKNLRHLGGTIPNPAAQ